MSITLYFLDLLSILHENSTKSDPTDREKLSQVHFEQSDIFLLFYAALCTPSSGSPNSGFLTPKSFIWKSRS